MSSNYLGTPKNPQEKWEGFFWPKNIWVVVISLKIKVKWVPRVHGG